MALEEKLTKSAKRSMGKEKKKKESPESGGRHAIVESHSKGGFSTEMHDHGRHEMCDGDCDSSAHTSMGSAMRAVKGHLGGRDADEGEEED